MTLAVKIIPPVMRRWLLRPHTSIESFDFDKNNGIFMG